MQIDPMAIFNATMLAFAAVSVFGAALLTLERPRLRRIAAVRSALDHRFSSVGLVSELGTEPENRETS